MDTIEWKAIDKTGFAISMWPIKPASQVDYVGKKAQELNEQKLAHCPGMHDYKNVGYIMCAWDDIHIFCSKESSMAYYGNPKVVKTRGTPFNDVPTECPWHKKSASNMNGDIIAGYEGRNDQFTPLHVTSPWMFQGDISMLVLPPYYHSNVSQIIDIFPGIVDYSDNFNTINFIFSPKKEGTHVIKAGTPLLHIIPIQKGNFKCEVTVANSSDHRKAGSMPARAIQFYRKWFMKKSNYEVEINDS